MKLRITFTYRFEQRDINNFLTHLNKRRSCVAFKSFDIILKKRISCSHDHQGQNLKRFCLEFIRHALTVIASHPKDKEYVKQSTYTLG